MKRTLAISIISILMIFMGCKTEKCYECNYKAYSNYEIDRSLYPDLVFSDLGFVPWDRLETRTWGVVGEVTNIGDTIVNVFFDTTYIRCGEYLELFEYDQEYLDMNGLEDRYIINGRFIVDCN